MCEISANWFIGSYLNLQLKIALKISQPKNRQNLKFCIFQVKFYRNRYQWFSSIFLHLLAVLLWAKYEKMSKIWRQNFKGGEIKENHLPPCYLPFCTMVVTVNICMPTEFWAPTRSFVQCWLVTRWPCDNLTMWRDDFLKKRACDELTCDELTEWRHDRVTRWPCDKLTGSRCG